MPTVALFVTCVVDQLAPDVGVSTVKLLEAAGCDVEFPEGQTCCGQPACNAGEPEAAARLAKHFLDVFEPFDAVVAPSGSCVAMVRHWYPRLVEPSDVARAEAVAARTYDLPTFLVDHCAGPDIGARVDAAVTVHDACHGLRTLGVKDAPRALLAAAGAEILEMVEPETCCGFGGTFSIDHREIAAPLADDKLAHADATSARWLVSGDSACLLHLDGRRQRTGVGPEPVHLATLLASGLDT